MSRLLYTAGALVALAPILAGCRQCCPCCRSGCQEVCGPEDGSGAQAAEAEQQCPPRRAPALESRQQVIHVTVPAPKVIIQQCAAPPCSAPSIPASVPAPSPPAAAAPPAVALSPLPQAQPAAPPLLALAAAAPAASWGGGVVRERLALGWGSIPLPFPRLFRTYEPLAVAAVPPLASPTPPAATAFLLAMPPATPPPVLMAAPPPMVMAPLAPPPPPAVLVPAPPPPAAPVVLVPAPAALVPAPPRMPGCGR
jgi:hypothetical protein